MMVLQKRNQIIPEGIRPLHINLGNISEIVKRYQPSEDPDDMDNDIETIKLLLKCSFQELELLRIEMAEMEVKSLELKS